MCLLLYGFVYVFCMVVCTVCAWMLSAFVLLCLYGDLYVWCVLFVHGLCLLLYVFLYGGCMVCVWFLHGLCLPVCGFVYGFVYGLCIALSMDCVCACKAVALNLSDCVWFCMVVVLF